GIMFLGFAVHTWLQKEEEVEHEGEEAVTRAHFLPSVWKAFLVIFIAEWGDLTQIATAGIAAKYHEDLFTILCSATLALWAVTAIAVMLGRKMRHFVNFDLLKKISVGVFLLVGAYFIWTWFRA
ncbi:MAG: TMEM165/GDT1 family protein, partial [Bdellovibrionota bacterium]